MLGIGAYDLACFLNNKINVHSWLGSPQSGLRALGLNKTDRSRVGGGRRVGCGVIIKPSKLNFEL